MCTYRECLLKLTQNFVLLSWSTSSETRTLALENRKRPFSQWTEGNSRMRMPPCTIASAPLVGIKATSKLLASRTVTGRSGKRLHYRQMAPLFHPSSPPGPHGRSQAGEQAVQTAEEPHFRTEDKSRQGRGLTPLHRVKGTWVLPPGSKSLRGKDQALAGPDCRLTPDSGRS